MRKRKKIIILLIGMIILLSIYTLIEPFWIQVKDIEVSHSDIPSSFNGYTIVFLTDIHHGPYFSQKRLGRIVERTNRMQPDLVLLGGDYVHRHDTRYIFSCFEELEKLDADSGIFGVLGNHDYWMSEELIVRQMEEYGIVLLRNRGVRIKKGTDSLFIGGVDDKMEGSPDIAESVREAAEEDFTLVVSHNPDVAEEQPLDKVDWILAGHTHGGQVTLFGQWAPVHPSAYGQKYVSGLTKAKETFVFVSNGVGTITPPVRFFARPQIIRITLKSDSGE